MEVKLVVAGVLQVDLESIVEGALHVVVLGCSKLLPEVRILLVVEIVLLMEAEPDPRSHLYATAAAGGVVAEELVLVSE